jgi:Fe-S-cluster formation regulator IscX/YfhJ
MKIDHEKKIEKDNRTTEERFDDITKFINQLDEFDEASKKSKLRFD